MKIKTKEDEKKTKRKGKEKEKKTIEKIVNNGISYINEK